MIHHHQIHSIGPIGIYRTTDMESAIYEPPMPFLDMLNTPVNCCCVILTCTLDLGPLEINVCAST